jgi:hypothetical protein
MDIPKARAIPIINNSNIEPIKNYDYSKIKTPLIYATFFAVMITLIGVVITLIYFPSTSSSGLKFLSQDENNTIMMITAFTVAILLIAFMTIPNYKELLNFLSRLKYVFILAAYIIGLIVLYRNVPRGIIDAYSFLFFPATVLIGFYLFIINGNNLEADSTFI